MTTKKYRNQPTTYRIHAFDLSTKIIGFGNGSNRVTTVAYEVKCHPVHSTLLKALLLKLSVSYSLSPSDTNIHFIFQDLIQSTDATTVKKPYLKQEFPIFNIPEVTMKTGIKTRLLKIQSRIRLEPTYLTESSRKWLVLVKKYGKIKQEEQSIL